MPGKNPFSPAKIAAAALARLKAQSDGKVARQSRSYFKPAEKVLFLGVRSPKVREIESEIYGSVKGSWGMEDALAFCDILMRNRYLEARGLGILLLSRFRKVFDRSVMEWGKQWLEDGFCGNWATTDTLSGCVLAPLVSRFPDLLHELRQWTSSPNLWMRRAAAVSLTPLARRGEHLDAAYAVAGSLSGDTEDLIHKAAGWLLRECGKKDEAGLESYLAANGKNMPRTTLRYAIERFPPERRRRFLRQSGTPAGA